MKQKTSYKLTGLFILIGLVCLFGIILKYAGKEFDANKEDTVVMYFEESIRGLSVGSSVVLNGVEVGKVEKVQLVADIKTGTFKTPVFVTFDNKVRRQKKNEKYAESELEYLIEKGLRARLESANYLTGQLMIELLMDPSSPIVMRGEGEYMEIPTIDSSFAMISKDLQEIPLRDIMGRFGSVLGELDKNLPDILRNITEITAKVDQIMDRKNGETTKTLNNFNGTLEEISRATRSLKNLTDYLERHPEALLKGKGK
ncbi:MAG: MCE family protein [Alphaproteobacteria bacterium]|nr:MCE family protein [Alphaproteobacteria bacterium]